MSTHLHAKMPHGTVAEIIEQASKAKSPEDLVQIQKKILFATQVFIAELVDFRASLPASEIKRGRPALIERRSPPRPEDWRPLEDIGIPEVDAEAALCSIAEFRSYEGYGYDHRPSSVMSLVVHDQTPLLREMIENGCNMRSFMKQWGGPGGGIRDLVRDNVRAYVCFNQLLHHDWDIIYELPDKELLRCGNAKLGVQQEALVTLREMLDDYDNHDYRASAAGRTLRASLRDGIVTQEQLRRYLKEHIFPELVRLSHAFLFSAVRHEGTPFRALTDPGARCAFDEHVRLQMSDAIVSCVEHITKPIAGVRIKEFFKHDREDDPLV